jgi:outer membrane immunogenic protein
VRGRIGFLAAPNLLLYGTGGLAYGQVRSSAISVFPPPGSIETYAGSISDTRVGWTAGAGGERLIGNGWSIKAEYLFVDLGSVSYANPCVSPPGICALVSPPPAYQTTVTTREHVARIGVIYHFGAPVVAKY